MALTNPSDALPMKGRASDMNTDSDSTDLREAANKAGRKVRSFITSANDELVHAKEAVSTQIHSNPVQSSLIALGVGFILGSVLRR